MTRAGLLRLALSQALRRVHIGAKKLKIDEETRWQIAGEAVGELAALLLQKGWPSSAWSKTGVRDGTDRERGMYHLLAHGLP